MKISGHKTNSIFRRYNITDEDDLREAAKKRDAYIATVEQNLADRYVSATFSDSAREVTNETS